MMEGVPPSLVGAVEPEPEPEPEPELALPEPEVGALSLWIPTGGATSLASRTAAPAVALRSRLAESLLEPAAQRLAFAGILNHRLGADSVATLRTTAVDADVLGKVGAVALQATSDTGCVDLDAAIALLKQGKLLSERQVKALCKRTKNVLMNEENVQRVPAPVTICGDLRGHFYELLNLFEIGGEVPSTNYLFLGKYIGRGCHQLLTFLLLIALKARWPCRVYLCRGSQESRQMTQVYGFYDECLRAYGTSEVWRCCMDVCDALTLSYVVEHHIFCVHGGLSPSVDTFSDIRSINRFQDVEPDGPMCDMLWSDPEDIAGWGMNPRGAGYVFGGDIVAQFCHRNDVRMIARGHQLVMEGFKFMFDEQLVTVWSTPNYMGKCGNVGAILQVDEQLRTGFLVFDGEPNNKDHWDTITRRRREAGQREDGTRIPDHWVRRDPATDV